MMSFSRFLNRNKDRNKDVKLRYFSILLSVLQRVEACSNWLANAHTKGFSMHFENTFGVSAA